MKKINTEYYTTESGKAPSVKWIKSLGVSSRAIIHKRIARLEVGNFGDTKAIKGTTGLYEMRIHDGPGYRVYFGKRKKILVVLICGGKKGSQSRDILKAKTYWQDYIENTEE